MSGELLAFAVFCFIMLGLVLWSLSKKMKDWEEPPSTDDLKKDPP